MNAEGVASSSSEKPTKKRPRQEEVQGDGSGALGINNNNNNNSDQSTPSQANNDDKDGSVDLLESFETFGWQPNPTISDDENFMDLTLLLTRNSQLKDGSMACLLVRKPQDEEGKQQQQQPGLPLQHSLVDRIISVANNQALYTRKRSDVHAEIVAIGQAARKGRPTENATAYITMPPCKNCFGALVAAGITRIYTQYDNANTQSRCVDAAAKHGGVPIVMESLGKDQLLPAARARVAEIVQKYQNDKQQQQQQQGQEQQQQQQQKQDDDNNNAG